MSSAGQVGESGAPPLGLRERKKARTRLELMNAAISLFREKGFAETTVADIVNSVEYSSSTFFRYFDSKEDVVFYGNDPRRLADDLEEQLESNRSQSAWQVLRSVLTADTVWMMTAEQSILADCIALWSTEPAVVRRRQQLIGESISVVADFLTTHVVRDDDGRLDALVAAHAILGVTTEIINLGPMAEDKILGKLDRGFAFVERGLDIRSADSDGTIPTV